MACLRASLSAFALVVAGCSFDSTGKGAGDGMLGSGSSGAESTTDPESSTTTTSTASMTGGGTDGSGTTDDPSAGTQSSAGTGEPEGSTGAGAALLEFDQAPSFNFGVHDVSTQVREVLDLTNVGDAEATSLMPPALPAPFSWAGGTYPGTDGTCGNSLGPGESCTVSVAYSPSVFGTSTTDVALPYESVGGAGAASVQLLGTGGGRTGNLIVNPGGEDGGSPPVGWTEVFGDDWNVYGSNGIPRTGSSAIFCGFVSGQSGTYRLQQTFDLTEYADVIDNQQGLQIDFEGYARTWGFNDDIYRFRLRTLDGVGGEVDVDVTANGTGSSWTLNQLGLVTQPGVRRVEIQLIGIFNAGSACDAFFDDLGLTLAYPPA